MAKVKGKKVQIPIKAEKDYFQNIWISMGILFLFWLIFFSKLILGNAYLWDDFAQQYYPGKTIASVFLSNGEFPFWNPYTFSGMPFFADLQIAVLYPFNYMLSFFVKGENISPVLLQFTIIIHYLLCSVFCFFIGRQLKLSNAASVILSILFTYSSYMIIHMIHMPLIEAVAWFPLIFLLWLKFIALKKYVYIFFAGIAMALCILAGYPQVAFFNYFFIAIYVLIIFLSKIKLKEYKICLNLSIGFLLFLIIPFGIAAIQLLPANEFVNLSNRASLDYDFARQGSIHFIDLITAIVPKVFGVWTENSSSTDIAYWTKHSEGIFMFSISNIYTSVLFVITIVPVMMYFIRKKDNLMLNYFLTGVIVFSILFALGGNFFLHKLLFSIFPVFNRFRNPGHILYLYTFSVSLLIAYGIDFFTRNKIELINTYSSKYFIWLISIFGFIFILVLMGIFNPDNIQNKEVPKWITKQYGIFIVFLLLFSGLIYFYSKGKLKKTPFLILLISLLCAEMYIIWFDQNNGSRNPETIFAQNNQDVKKFREELKSDYFRINMRKYFSEGGSYSHFQRNQGMVDRIPLIEGYGALLLNRFHTFDKPDSGSTQNFDLMNVKYRIEVDRTRKAVSFALNTACLPRASMFYDIRVIENDTVALREYMESKEFDHKKTLVLEKNPGNVELPVITDSLNLPKSSVRITDFRNDKISIDAETSENGFLFLSEIYYPAWKAFIDGKETEIFRTDFCLRSVYVNKGNHKIEFIYDSDTFRTGKTISVSMITFTLISILFLLIRYRTKSKN